MNQNQIREPMQQIANNLQSQQIVANRIQVNIQAPNRVFVPFDQSSLSFCDIYGKLNQTASHCWWMQKPQGRDQPFPFPNQPKTILYTKSASQLIQLTENICNFKQAISPS